MRAIAVVLLLVGCGGAPLPEVGTVCSNAASGCLCTNGTTACGTEGYFCRSAYGCSGASTLRLCVRRTVAIGDPDTLVSDLPCNRCRAENGGGFRCDPD